MSESRDLRLHIVPPGCGGSFIARRAGGYVLLEAITEEALDWLKAHVSEEASWDGDHLFIEPRYFPPLCDAIIEEGFLFEVDTGKTGEIQ
ncbi:hypothetical protein [Sphingomonas oryzagri]|uniref:Uncharacterized protein n=1 Tax=Sphingomonas oryzagri TaxID=3042314 RepID=A0ABT6N4E3_9SPHN|nr:hypothetical protein [Sphingomonas oryzagri]MDH7639231.1 hypothetical protein [Sphingomonas oryzagri]